MTPVPPPGDDWPALKAAVLRFEAAWAHAPRPRIEDFLPAAEPLRRRVLIELAHLELELRLKAGEPGRVEDYLGRFPELAADRAAVLDLIGAEHDLRRRGEPGLGLDAYQARFPAFAAELAGRVSRPTVAAAPLPAEPPPDPLPEVPGYAILGLLGRGGMGVVYRARQLSLDRPVALKFLPAAWARDPVWLDRFRREARTASALNHPNVCTIYDTGEHAGRPFLSMELIDGRTLEALAAARPPLADVVGWVRQAARALAAAHAAGVVHRDVKPANLMVRGDGLVKVLDFGLARRVPAAGAAGPDGPGTDPGTRVGTVLYMAPEQARGEPAGGACDVFALGLVLYELATGRHPFLADTEVAVLHALATQAPLPAARLNPEVPAALEALLQQMLAKDARLRPTAAEVDGLLGELAGPGNAPGPSPERPARRRVVGRRAELDALHHAFARADAGHGALVCVTGEPGLGKTTVVEEFLDELAAGGRLVGVARGRCSERLAGAEAYLPVLEALDHLLQGTGGAAAARVLKVVAPTWYAQLAPLAAADPALAEARGASQERRKRELAVFLQEAARLRPLVVFLDDVHWADPSSTDLLAYLGARCAAWRVLLVTTYRPADLLRGRHPFGAVKLDLQARGACREIALPFLGRDDLDRFLELTFPGHDFPAALAEVLHARTGGNPLFLADLVRALRDRGALAEINGCWVLAREVPDLARELPESIRGLIQRQVDLLAEADRQLLMAASVQGPEFDSAVVARVLGRDPALVEERLEVLERAHGLIRLVREHAFPDRTPSLRYAFVHVLYQNALYAALRPTRKAAWSTATAQALLGHHGEQCAAVAADLALLYEAARQPLGAIEFFLLAARNAGRGFAHREAVALARRGLGQVAELPDTPARAAQELALLNTLGVSLVATQGFAAAEVEQTFLRARLLCLRTEDTATLFPVLYGLWNVALLRCDFGRCKDLAAQMFALAQGQPDPVLVLQAHNVRQQPLVHQGDFATALRHQEQAQALYDPPRHRTLTAVFGEDPGVGCQIYAAVTRWCLGYPDQALQAVLAARRLAEELPNPFDLARALYFGAFVHLLRRDPAQTEAWAQALRELTEDRGFPLLLHGADFLLARCRAERGDVAAGIAAMREGLAGWQATGARSHRPYQLALLGAALAHAGQAAEGLATLDEALATAAATGERFLEAELHRLRGEALGGAEAEAAFRRALEVARRQQARSLELRAALSLGRLYRGQGRRDEARRLVADVHGWFTEGFATVDWKEGQAYLAEETASAARPASAP